MVEALVADKAYPRLLRYRQQGDLRPTERAKDRNLVAVDSCAGGGNCLVRRSLHLSACEFWAGIHADPSDHAHYYDADLDRRLGRARGDDDGRVRLCRAGSNGWNGSFDFVWCGVVRRGRHWRGSLDLQRGKDESADEGRRSRRMTPR